MNFFTFIKETDGFENSLNFAMKFGLLPDKEAKDCIKCGTKKGLRWTKNARYAHIPYVYVCSVKGCRATVSLSRNTMFDHLTFPLSSALRLIYMWLMKISVEDCANQFEVGLRLFLF